MSDTVGHWTLGSFAVMVRRRSWAPHAGQGSDMAEVLLFHHAQGQTPGFQAFADDLRRAGHTVHAPDLYDGRTFDSLDAGMAYAEAIGFGQVIERGTRVAEGLPAELVYAGFS